MSLSRNPIPKGIAREEGAEQGGWRATLTDLSLAIRVIIATRRYDSTRLPSPPCLSPRHEDPGGRCDDVIEYFSMGMVNIGG